MGGLICLSDLDSSSFVLGESFFSHDERIMCFVVDAMMC
jgi:hypothetical protein